MATTQKKVPEAATYRSFVALSEDEQELRLGLRAEFMFITRRVSPHTCAVLMPGSGINWCGCTRGHMADQWLSSIHDSWRVRFNEAALDAFVTRLDKHLSDEAENARSARLRAATYSERKMVNYLDSDNKKRQEHDLRACAVAELKGMTGVRTSRSRAGLVRRGYMQRVADRVSLAPEGWLAAARALNAKADKARHKRNSVQQYIRDWSHRGDKGTLKAERIEAEHTYNKYVALAERALKRANEEG
jgi:hypothetical protein